MSEALSRLLSKSINEHIPKKKGQGSVEYLSVVGIALMLLIPATMLFTNYTRSANEEVLANQLNMIGQRIMNKAEEMYVIGTNSWSTIETTFPDSFESATFYNGSDLVFRYATGSGYSDVVFFAERFTFTNGTCNSDCNLSFSTGVNRIRIELIGSEIELRKI